MRKALLILLFLGALTACKKEVTDNVDQDKIFTQYVLSYDENTNETSASATFRFSNLNGTRLMLSDPSTVTADGVEMEWSNEDGNYQTNYTGLVPSVTFNWVDLDGNSYTNTAEIRDIDFESEIDTLYHTDSVTFFTWAGSAPLDSSETARLIIYQEDEEVARAFSVDTLGATQIQIDSVMLSQIDSGMVRLVLEKIYSPEMQEANSKGGLLVGKYRPADRTTLLD